MHGERIKIVKHYLNKQNTKYNGQRDADKNAPNIETKYEGEKNMKQERGEKNDY